MLTIESRPMTAEERATLAAQTLPWGSGCADGCVQHFILLVGFPVLGMLAATPFVAVLDYFQGPRVIGEALFVLGVVAGFVMGVLGLRSEWAVQMKSRALFQQDIDAGRVNVLHCTATRAVEFPVDEDEGPGFFLEVGENQVLFLHNPWLLEFEGDLEAEIPAQFPNQRFDVVQAIVSKTTLNLICLGEPLAEWQEREDEDWPEDSYSPADGEVLALSLDTLEEGLKRLGAEKHDAATR